MLDDTQYLPGFVFSLVSFMNSGMIRNGFSQTQATALVWLLCPKHVLHCLSSNGSTAHSKSLCLLSASTRWPNSFHWWTWQKSGLITCHQLGVTLLVCKVKTKILIGHSDLSSPSILSFVKLYILAQIPARREPTQYSDHSGCCCSIFGILVCKLHTFCKTCWQACHVGMQKSFSTAARRCNICWGDLKLPQKWRETLSILRIYSSMSLSLTYLL